MITVESLRKQGYKVRVIHERWNLGAYNACDDGYVPLMSRFEAEENGMHWEPSSNGGNTIVQITTPDGEKLEGQAYCSDMDNFNRRFGIQLALARAFSNGTDLSEFQLPDEYITPPVCRHLQNEITKAENINRKVQQLIRLQKELEKKGVTIVNY